MSRLLAETLEQSSLAEQMERVASALFQAGRALHIVIGCGNHQWKLAERN